MKTSGTRLVTVIISVGLIFKKRCSFFPRPLDSRSKLLRVDVCECAKRFAVRRCTGGTVLAYEYLRATSCLSDEKRRSFHEDCKPRAPCQGL